MTTNTRIARIISVYYLVTGSGFLLSADFFNRMIVQTGSDPVLIKLSGIVHFFIGMTIMVFHFRWKKPLEIIVTILGILFFLKGVALIALPELTLQTGNNPAQSTWLMATAFIAIGVVVGYLVFFTNILPGDKNKLSFVSNNKILSQPNKQFGINGNSNSPR